MKVKNFFIIRCAFSHVFNFSFSDDIVYNQSMVGGNTMDKRRPDLRDELGYIAPPNRKLPPVPGSNYNTCDRIKRGATISKTNLFLLNVSVLDPVFVACLSVVSSLSSSVQHILLPLQFWYAYHAALNIDHSRKLEILSNTVSSSFF